MKCVLNVQPLCFVLILCWGGAGCQQLEQAATERELLLERRKAAADYDQNLQPVHALQSKWNAAASSITGNQALDIVVIAVKDSALPALKAYAQALTKVSIENSELQTIHDDLCTAHRQLIIAYQTFVEGLDDKNYARRSDRLRLDYERFRGAQATYRSRLSETYSRWGIQLRTAAGTSVTP